MKLKRFTTLLVLSLASVSLLSSCGKRHDLFFSTLFNGEDIEDCALSISTTSDNVSLKGVKLNIYSGPTISFSYTFNDESIEPGKPITLGNLIFGASHKVENLKILDSNEIKTDAYYELVDSKGNVIDSLGNSSVNTRLVRNESLIRLLDRQYSREKYNKQDYIKVQNKGAYILNSIYTSKEILDGPRLDELTYGKYPVLEEGSPKGGYCEATLHSLGDGDTTQLDFPESSGLLNGYKHRVRYLYINTPEVDHGSGSSIQAQPFGEAAKKFNNDMLRNASIIFQSDRDGSIRDTYSRTLGFIWYSNKDNPKIEDYRLLNFDMVITGLAQLNENVTSSEMLYRGISYVDYVRYAYEYARENKLKIHGEIDKDFDYDKIY